MSEAIAPSIGFVEGCRRELDALRHLAADGPELLAGVWQERWGRVILAGIGASHAALASPLAELRAAGIDASRSDCSDLPRVSTRRPDVLIAVSQSGRSRETADVVRRFAEADVSTLAITNSETSPLRTAADATVTLGGAADSRVSTVGFVTTFTALGMLVDLATTGRVDAGWSTLAEVIEAAVVDAQETIQEFAGRHLASGGIDVVATNSQLTTAEAVALLFREGPLIPSTAFGTRGYLHGPMDIAGGAVSHLVIGGGREAQLAEQLLEQTEAVLLLTDGSVSVPDRASLLTVPAGLTASQRALVETCVLQELVAASSEVRGNPVDETVFTRQDTKIDAVGELG